MSAISTLDSLLSQYHSLPLLSRRAVASIVGASVGDAASRPAHWIYDRKVMEATIGNANPEFWPVNISPYYSLPTGMRSCYSDESVAMLNSLYSTKNVFNVEVTKNAIQAMFSPDSIYAQGLALRAKMNEPGQVKGPIDGAWQQGSITNYLKAFAEKREVLGDATNTETDGYCLSLPLAARYCPPYCNVNCI